MKQTLLLIAVLSMIIIGLVPVQAQISPGDLAEVHAHLEGMSNCTKCHILGDKVSNAKCLQCHTELKSQLDIGRGYHASSQVKGKECVSCHNDHHGRKFQIVKFNKETFDHSLTGYKLLGAHTKKECTSCHKPAFITKPAIKTKKFTYLGLGTSCSNCHTDYHQKTLSLSCENCHGVDAFKPAVKFRHSTAKFQLSGKHTDVSCDKCHKVGTKNGQKFQEFTGLQYKTCANCHKDPHHNQFGQNCIECHSVESFQTVKAMNKFDHSKTAFKLEDKHQFVTCKSCHKSKFTDPVNHAKCLDCHKDYHNSQFTRNDTPQDCSACHSTKGFTGSSFTIERHNEGSFKLIGSHQATPCISCHKKSDKWNFRNIGKKCVDCHTDIHSSYISQKYYPEASCESCHTSDRWNQIKFDHNTTGFSLAGVHETVNCRSCHFVKDASGQVQQRFSSLKGDCNNCHSDNHNRQFEVDGKTDCLRCHVNTGWLIPNFDHNKTSFKLDGKHALVACNKCHKPVTDQQVTFVLYKIKETKCENCH